MGAPGDVVPCPMAARRPARSPEVEAYVAAAPPGARAHLERLCALVRKEAPDAVERMAYGLPTWHQGENLVHLGAFARHVGLYPGAAAIEAFADELRDYRTSKGAIQLPHDRPLPVELVRRIVRARVAQAPAATDRAAARPRRATEALRDPGPLTFEATLVRAGEVGAACFVSFPWGLKETYGKGNLVPVDTRWDERVRYRGSLAMMGGASAMLLCRSDVAAALGKGPGDRVRVEVRLDLAPREVEVPEALAAALSGAPAARVAKAVPMIAAGARLKG